MPRRPVRYRALPLIRPLGTFSPLRREKGKAVAFLLPVRPRSAPDQFAAAVDAHHVDHVAGVADGGQGGIVGLHQAAAAGAAGGHDLQGADHQFAAAGQGEGDFLHALGLPVGDFQFVAQVVVDLVAVHFHAGGGGVALVVALALAGADGAAVVVGGGVLGQHAGGLAPLGGAAPGGWAGRGAVLGRGDGLLAGRGLGLGFVGGDGVFGFGGAGGVDGGGDGGGHQGLEGLGAFAGGLGAGGGHGRLGVVLGGVAQEVDLDPGAAAAVALGLGQFQLGGVQQGQHEEDVHQQADQGADPALLLFDVGVFPVQRVEQRRAGAARRVAHVGAWAAGVGDFMGEKRGAWGRH